MSSGSFPAEQNSFKYTNIIKVKREELARIYETILILSPAIIITSLFSDMNTTHVWTHFKKPSETQRNREKRGPVERGKEVGSHGRVIKQSSDSMVTGVHWEQGRRKSEYRCYQTYISHSPSVSLFSFSL